MLVLIKCQAFKLYYSEVSDKLACHYVRYFIVEGKRTLHALDKKKRTFLLIDLPGWKKKRAKCLLFLIVFLWITASTFARQDDTKWERAGELIRTGNYAAALREIDHQLKNSPDNVLLLRFKGICLTELGNLGEATTILHRALEIDSQNIASRYYLSQALAYSGNISEAIKYLSEIQQMVPESKYAEQARKILPELENLKVAAEPFPTEKRWHLTLRSALEYDDNVPMASREDDKATPTDSFRFVIPALYGEYRIWDESIDHTPVTVGGGYALYQSLYERAPLNDFRLTSQNFRTFLRRSGQVLNFPYQAAVENSYIYASLGGKLFSYGDEIKVSSDLQLHRRMMLSSFYSVIVERFKKAAVFPDFFSRDGSSQTLGVGPTFYILQNRVIFNCVYTYTLGGTTGSQFDQDRHGVSTSVLLALPWKIKAAGGFQYQRSDYTDFTDFNSFTRRLDSSYAISAGLSRAIWKDKLVLELNYQHTWNRSKQTFADYRQNIFGTAFTYNF